MEGFLNYEGAKLLSEEIKSRLKAVAEMPEKAEENRAVLYIGETTGQYVKGHIYQSEKSAEYYALEATVENAGTLYFYLKSLAVGAKPIYQSTMLVDPEDSSKGALPVQNVIAGENCQDVTEYMDVMEISPNGDVTLTPKGGAALVFHRRPDLDLGAATAWGDITPVNGETASGMNSGLTAVTEMPTEAENGSLALYVGDSANGYTKGHIYQYNKGETYYAFKLEHPQFNIYVYLTKIAVGTKPIYTAGPTKSVSDFTDSSEELNITEVLSDGNLKIAQSDGQTFRLIRQADLDFGSSSWTDLTPNSSEPAFGYIGNEVETKVDKEWTTTFQNGSESKQITLSQDGWYYINSKIWQNEKKDSNTIVFANTLDEGQAHTLFRHGYNQAGESVQSAMLPLKAGVYSVSHAASANNVDGYAEFYINRWSVAK